MIDIIPYFKQHSEHFTPALQMDANLLGLVEENDTTWTVVKDGAPMVIWGITPIWNGRGVAWAFCDKRSASCMHSITRVVRQALDHMSQDRIEADARVSVPQSWKWLILLGFKREAFMQKFYPDGGDAFLFARVRE